MEMRVVVYGGKGTGKTTLADRIAAENNLRRVAALPMDGTDDVDYILGAFFYSDCVVSEALAETEVQVRDFLYQWGEAESHFVRDILFIPAPLHKDQ